MELLSSQINDYLGNSSMIRRMFEAGIELKKKYGADNVYDFSLGNPDLPPPPEVAAAMKELAAEADKPFSFGYMPNAGSMEARSALARLLTQEQGIGFSPSQVVATCGAAGAINAFFRAVLTPGDEVLCPSPYFVEYGFYCGNYGGILKPVRTKEDFSLDVDAISAAVTPRTRAIILNSPNNPTGKIYAKAELSAVAEVLRAASAKTGKMVYLIADEPYRFLNFDNVEIPSLAALYEGAVVIGSFSKSLSLPGERIGYIAVSPLLKESEKLVAALTLTNRILGYVNAPIVGQKLIEACWASKVDLDIYRRRRDLMAQVLTDAGIEFILPRGAFYFFPKSPVADERIFVDALLQERVLAVPGRGFGAQGYFRLAFCVSEKTIADSAESFKKAVKRLPRA